ncbi:MAG: PP2C family protein-serine/threonine phosphatase [Terriglobales bacterium]
MAADLHSWKTVPFSSSVLFFAGVFCLLGAMFLVIASANLDSQSAGDVFLTVLISGSFAVGWAYAGTTKKYWLFGVFLAAQVILTRALQPYMRAPHSLAADVPALNSKLHLDASVEFVLMVAAYVFFLVFFGREGNRFFRTQTEVRLAGEIHRTLVPQKHVTIGNFEMFGSSVPSSEVGGDLFDIVQSDGMWHAYVADVSGHGVAAGILMSMIKSAAAMQLTKLKKPEELLRDLNDVLQPVTAPANYLTFAYVSGAGGDLSFALAGHLPILHYQKAGRNVSELSDSNVPIGMFKDQQFAISKMHLAAGDLLALITDGFTEVFDSSEREIGMEDFKSALSACAERPLPQIYAELRARTLKFGKQSDDQTMLLIRRLA